MFSDRFDIAATMPTTVTKAHFYQMLRNLLTERFKLEVHTTEKEAPILELTVARGGVKLTPSHEPEIPQDGDGGDGKRVGPAETDTNGFPKLTGSVRQRGTFDNGVMRSAFKGYTLSEFCVSLGSMVGMSEGRGLASSTRIVDKTSIGGRFDFNLMFAGSPFQGAPPIAGAASPLPEVGVDAPDLFGALERQLGLVLRKGKEKIEVLVVDWAERIPAEN